MCETFPMFYWKEMMLTNGFSIDYSIAWGIYNYLLEGMLGNYNSEAYGNDEGP
jgi:hypothetical protein